MFSKKLVKNVPIKCSKTVTRNVFPSWAENTDRTTKWGLSVIPVCSVCWEMQNQVSNDKRFKSKSWILMKVSNTMHYCLNTKLHLQMLTCTWIVSCSCQPGFQESTWLSCEFKNPPHEQILRFPPLKPHLNVADTVTPEQALKQHFCNNMCTDLCSTHTCFSQSWSLMLFKKELQNLSVCLSWYGAYFGGGIFLLFIFLYFLNVSEF